ncbi:hypothetical protein [Providencia vermicola]|uniref:hypothetical protein n=1 Tax=Providencia vermicola TaxID=333965 RepID=UPI0021FEC10B|nr:hypothetical protein NFC79_10030 [Providencia stuartii]
MKKTILLFSMLSTSVLFVSGCSSNTDVWGKFSNILDGAMPFVKESEDWEEYSVKTAQQGVIYAKSTTADQQFVSKKMNDEYADAVNRVASPFALTSKTKQKLADANQGYQFKYNEIMTVKDKQSSKTIGYCVNYDSDRVIDGKIAEVKDEDKIRKDFIYVAKDRPISVATVTETFTKTICGQEFYKKFKG